MTRSKSQARMRSRLWRAAARSLDQPGVQGRRTEATVAAHQAHQQAGRRRRARPEVEGEIAQDERAAGAVEEDHLVLVRTAAEEHLLHLVLPLGGGFVVEHGDEHQIGTLARQPRRHPQARLGIGTSATSPACRWWTRFGATTKRTRPSASSSRRSSGRSRTGECSSRLPSASRITVMRVPTSSP